MENNESQTTTNINRVTDSSSSSSSRKYKGVRLRKWGKYVSEIRLPNSRERIWLGSYDSAVKAARAFDAAQYCLRGPSAKFNFPDTPPDIAGGMSLTPGQIQLEASRFANSYHEVVVEVQQQQADDDLLSLSMNTTNHEEEGVDHNSNLLDQFRTMSWDNNNFFSEFGYYQGFDNFQNDQLYLQGRPYDRDVHEDEETCDEFYGSLLWNF